MPTVYRSTDTDAPVLTGLVGSLITVLDACLVDGYTGKAAAGWTKEFTGTNQAAYRNDHVGGASGAYFLVEDDAPATTTGGDSRIRAYGTMTAIDAGTHDTDPEWFRKGAANGNARPWVLVADGLTFWMYNWDNGDTTASGADANMCGAGDYDSIDANNAFRYFVVGSNGAAHSSAREYARRFRVFGRTVHPDGVTGKVRFTPTPPPNSFSSVHGNAGSTSAVCSFASLVNFDEPALHVGTQLLGKLRGVKRPINKMWDLEGIERGQVFGDSGLIWTQVNVFGAGDSTVGSFAGALMINTAGPW